MLCLIPCHNPCVRDCPWPMEGTWQLHLAPYVLGWQHCTDEGMSSEAWVTCLGHNSDDGSRHKIGSVRLPQRFSCFVSLLYKHSVWQVYLKSRVTWCWPQRVRLVFQSWLSDFLELSFHSLCSLFMPFLLCEMRMTASQVNQDNFHIWGTLRNGGETAWVEGTKEWGDRKEEGGGCPEGKLTTSLGFALLVHCTRNTFFLVRGGGGDNNQLLCVRRTHQGVCFMEESSWPERAWEGTLLPRNEQTWGNGVV